MKTKESKKRKSSLVLNKKTVSCLKQNQEVKSNTTIIYTMTGCF